jgi:hypothetical protein
MHEQIANRHLACDIRIGNAELGDVAHNGIVPTQLAVIDQNAERHRSKRLGRGCKRK